MKAAAIRISRFHAGLMPRILEIETLSFPEDPYPEALFRQYQARCPELFLVARRGGEVAGYSITCAHGSRAELISIAVAPPHRRAGVAQALLDRTIRALRRSGVRDFDLMVRVSSVPAIAFYARNGFVKRRAVRRYYPDGEAGIHMRKTLE
ncbi:MAG: GNAT family N-acetyltransferase [Bryobacteraceae bacterium]|nr:GNAT family N-acetyltransferase [Bryobacteraceae bacterium]